MSEKSLDLDAIEARANDPRYDIMPSVRADLHALVKRIRELEAELEDVPPLPDQWPVDGEYFR